MGKASRRRHTRTEAREAAPPAPFVGRPFAGLPAETEWVAMRELLPAATAEIRLAPARADDTDLVPDGWTADRTVTVATVLPMAWPALHRGDGAVFVAIQSGATSGDASRDLAAGLVLALQSEPGTPIVRAPMATADSPRLQDLLEVGGTFEVTLHEGFEFWVGEQELDSDAAASLERANASVIPTVRLDGAPSVYWAGIGDRCYVRWILPADEADSTDALARLHAAGQDRLVPDSRLLGAFRACGLLVPVWEVDVDTEPESLAEPVTAMAPRLAEATASTAALTPDERRARGGILGRQVTLR
jgi:hypothetical protein